MLTLLAAAAGVGAWRFATWSEDAKDAELKQFQTDSQVAISQSQGETAKAQLATEQLKAQLAWRTINPLVASALVTNLAATPGSVFIRYVSGDPESTYLAIQLQKIFTDAKWQTAARGDQYPGAVFWGVYIPNDPANDPQVLQNMRDAFTKSGFSFSTNSPPPLGGMSVGQGKPGNSADIVVGSKPPPQ